MAICPVCGGETPPESVNCPTCQLAVNLFEPVREAIGPATGDLEYARAIAEMLAMVGTDSGAAAAMGKESGAVVTSQARFPSLGSAPLGRKPMRPVPTVPTLPELPAGSGLSLAQSQVEELLQVGRREGLDLQEADRRKASAVQEGSSAALDELRRSLFVQVAAAVAEDLEVQTARRNELSALVPTDSIDGALAASHQAFDGGDLPGTVRRLRQAADELSTLEERWATCQVLTTEADLMVETLRELGQEPGPALDSLAEGRRLARSGDPGPAERILAGANRTLWGLLVPQMNASLRGIRSQLHGRAPTGEEIEPVVRELRQLAALIRRRNFGAAVTAYRRLRAAAAALSPPASAELPVAAPSSRAPES